MKQLSELISFELSDTFKSVEIKDVTDDSRKVVSGGMFVAVEGNAADGKQYIQDAIAKGAVCVVLNGSKNSVRKNGNVIEIYLTKTIAKKFFCRCGFPDLSRAINRYTGKRACLSFNPPFNRSFNIHLHPPFAVKTECNSVFTEL